MMQETYSLYEYNQLVSEVVANSMPSRCWVEAELSEIRESNGHCYMTLVQKDVFQNTPVARASAKCWRNQWSRVAAKFSSVTSSGLYPGMKILLLVSSEFHVAFGFSLIAHDIDPTFTLGEMARKRQEIIKQLQEEGVYDLQKQLTIPLLPQRIAVISSATAAGYGDFCSQLQNNEYGIVFTPVLFPAIMQGEGVEASVIEALDRINSQIDAFDCVVIIRGGGATSDMSGFDTLLLGENVANFPIPVITGIGHDRDECVLDLVACKALKTPTAVAAFLVEMAVSTVLRIEKAQASITKGVGMFLERHRYHLQRLTDVVSTAITVRTTKEKGKVQDYEFRIPLLMQRMLEKRQHKIQMLEQRLELLDPALLLKRGYSITTLNGKVVKESHTLKTGDNITTRFADGIVISTVR